MTSLEVEKFVNPAPAPTPHPPSGVGITTVNCYAVKFGPPICVRV
jgi:hypothetical protein